MNRNIEYREDFPPTKPSTIRKQRQLESRQNSLDSLRSWFQNCTEQRAKAFLTKQAGARLNTFYKTTEIEMFGIAGRRKLTEGAEPMDKACTHTETCPTEMEVGQQAVGEPFVNAFCQLGISICKKSEFGSQYHTIDTHTIQCGLKT